VGDLETEERTGCVTQGFQVLCSLLKTANQDVLVVDKGYCLCCCKTRHTLNLNGQTIVVFLNKKDLLDKAIEKSGHEKLVNNWFKAAIANLDSSDRPQEEVSLLREAICRSKDAYPSNAALFFFDIVQRLAKSRLENKTINERGQVQSAASVIPFYSTATDTNESSVLKWIIEASSSIGFRTSHAVGDFGIMGNIDAVADSGLDSQSIELVLEIYGDRKTKDQSSEDRIRLLDTIQREILDKCLLPLRADLKAIYKVAFPLTNNVSEPSQKTKIAIARLNGGNATPVTSWLKGVVGNWQKLRKVEPPTEDEFYILYTRHFPEEIRQRYQAHPTSDKTLPPGDSGSGKGSTQPDEGPSNFSVFNPMSIKI
jgi:hypothetical protein